MSQQSQGKSSGKKRGKAIGLIALIVLVLAGAGFALYVNDFSRAHETAQQAAADEGVYFQDAVSVQQSEDALAFVPESPQAGLVFYPGGKVEAEAYAPLMQDLAQQGILCVICPMPFNLAVFDIHAADGVISRFPQVPADRWYMGGHSLGGSMAAQCLADYKAQEETAHDFAGIVLLGSYSTADLSSDDLRALLIHGSQDTVMNASSYEDNKTNLPQDTQEHVIEGGNHAQFGDYGAQAGDGSPSITSQEQWRQTAQLIAAWMTE